MWDANCDLEAPVRDVPCNTHIFFRVVNGKLDMMVCNRSNDMVWGALGANVVHMTYLHELVARGVGVPLGTYRVITNNLHVYKDRPDVQRLWDTTLEYDLYKTMNLKTYPILAEGEYPEALMEECVKFIETDVYNVDGWSSSWLEHVARPMCSAYLYKEQRDFFIDLIKADDWRYACEAWAARRNGEVSSNPESTASQDS
jgi:hypothetical protein